MAFWNPTNLPTLNPADPRYRSPPFQSVPQSPGPSPFPLYPTRGAYSSPVASLSGRPPTAQERFAGGYRRRTPLAAPMQTPMMSQGYPTPHAVTNRYGQSYGDNYAQYR